MIIFGTRWITWGSTPANKQSRCTRCGRTGEFSQRTRMRFGHIFWIPLLPLSGKHEVFQCSCGAVYDQIS